VHDLLNTERSLNFVCRSDWPELLDLGTEEGKNLVTTRTSCIAWAFSTQPQIPNQRFMLLTVTSRAHAVSVQAPPGSCFGWRAGASVRVFSFPDRAPGLYVLPSALSVSHQRELAVHAYTTLAHPQYDCSLQRTVCLPPSRPLFELWRDSLRTDCPAIASEARDCASATIALEDSVQPGTSAEACLEPLPRDAAGIERVLRRLRWTALGYRYDWGSLSYDWGQQPQPLPECVARVARDTVSLLQQPPVALQCGVYKPQAAVVNFYQIGDSLTSHVDRSEPAARAPLVMKMTSLCCASHTTTIAFSLHLNCACLQVSLSLGCAAVFVFGGESRDDDTLALLLRSGDVLVMVRAAVPSLPVFF
jgi:alkylated DNA repair dioxygenase AlkB